MSQKLNLLLLLLLCTVAAGAQAPNRFNYQTIVRNAAGLPVMNQSVNLRFTIHDASVTGTVLYSETQVKNTNGFGLYTAAIGDGIVWQGNLNTIEWGNGSKFLQVEMDTGPSFADMGTTELISVPYAVYASNGINNGTGNYIPKYVSATSMSSSQLYDNGLNVGIGTVSPTEKLHLAGNLKVEGSAELFGAFRVQGSAGNFNDVLVSNGSGNAPAWLSVGIVMADKLHIAHGTTTQTVDAAHQDVLLTDLTYPFTLATDSKVMVQEAINYSTDLGSCQSLQAAFRLRVYNINTSSYVQTYFAYGDVQTNGGSNFYDKTITRAFSLPAGAYRLETFASTYFSGTGCLVSIDAADIYVTILN